MLGGFIKKKNYIPHICEILNIYISSNFNFMPCRLHSASNGNAISESQPEYEGHAHITSLRNYNYVIPRTKWRLDGSTAPYSSYTAAPRRTVCGAVCCIIIFSNYINKATITIAMISYTMALYLIRWHYILYHGIISYTMAIYPIPWHYIPHHGPIPWHYIP